MGAWVLDRAQKVRARTGGLRPATEPRAEGYGIGAPGLESATRAGTRPGDAAPLAILELVDRPETPKEKTKKDAKLTPEQKAAEQEAAKQPPRPQSQSQIEKERADWEGMAQKTSDPGEDASMFEPAEDKIYRHPTFYDIPDGITHI